MPKRPAIEDGARQELLSQAFKIRQIRERIEAIQKRLAPAPSEDPLVPDTLSAVCEEVIYVFLGPAERRLELIASLTPELLARRREHFEDRLALVLSAADGLPEEHVYGLLARLIGRAPAEWPRYLREIRLQGEARFKARLGDEWKTEPAP